MSLKIGVLSTCVGAEEIYQKHMSESEQIELRLKSIRPNWHFKTYRAYIGEFPESLKSCDGYVLSGSPASVNTKAGWIDRTLDYIRRLHDSRISMIGICFGHQAIAKALGGGRLSFLQWDGILARLKYDFPVIHIGCVPRRMN